VITIDFTKGGFVGGQVANVKVELVITDARIGDFQAFTVEVLDASRNTVATLTKTTPVDSFQVTVPSPLSALCSSHSSSPLWSLFSSSLSPSSSGSLLAVMLLYSS
jgi:hypothetical protein